MGLKIIQTSETKFRVGVFWQHEGSGGSEDFPTLAQAEEACRRLEKLGYHKPPRSVIHVQKITQKKMVYYPEEDRT